jgi:prevent-host-death family protein
MRTAKISELKAKLSAHIAYVKQGEEVLIFDRNTPVARLVSVGPVEEEDARERRLFAKGILIPPRDPHNRGGYKPAPAGNKTIPQEVMDIVWEEERAGRC